VRGEKGQGIGPFDPA